jgi:hypothetical protein
MVNKALLLGPSGIGQAHLRELIKFKFSNIYLLGKKFKTDRIKKIKLKLANNIKLFNLRKISEVKKNKFTLSMICTPTHLHYKHIQILKNSSDFLIVEKPLIWIKQKNISNFKMSKKILGNSKTKIFINLPMISLGNQLMKKKKIKKIKEFNFSYFTNGKNTYDDIAVDLLPHALSLFFKLTKNTYKYLNILQVTSEKLKWSCKLNIDGCNCVFSFKQGIKKKGSQLFFEINDDLYERKQIKVGENYINKLVKNKKEIIKLKNPMGDYLQYIMKNFNNKLSLKNNNQITINSVKVAENLINFK